MPNDELLPAPTGPQTTDEFFEAAKLEFARGLARLAKTDNANPRVLQLLQRAIHNRDLINLRKRRLELRSQHLDHEIQQFNARNSVRPRSRLVAIEIHPPSAMQNDQ